MLCLERKVGALVVLSIPPSSQERTIVLRVNSVGKVESGEQAVVLAFQADRSVGIDRSEVFVEKIDRRGGDGHKKLSEALRGR